MMNLNNLLPVISGQHLSFFLQIPYRQIENPTENKELYPYGIYPQFSIVEQASQQFQDREGDDDGEKGAVFPVNGRFPGKGQGRRPPIIELRDDGGGRIGPLHEDVTELLPQKGFFAPDDPFIEYR